jgi:alkylhydroperoxidase/carboxymuconolactone decarboxylase family protein YurZ
MQVNMALRSGAKRAELKEVILHAAPDAGFTSALSAMLRLKLLTWRRGRRERQPGGAQTAGSGAAPDIPALLPPATDPALAEQFRRAILPICRRPGLELEDRVLVTIACDVTQGTLGQPFAFHLAIAEAAGVPRTRLEQTVQFVSEYAFGRSWQALLAMRRPDGG